MQVLHKYAPALNYDMLHTYNHAITNIIITHHSHYHMIQLTSPQYKK